MKHERHEAGNGTSGALVLLGKLREKQSAPPPLDEGMKMIARELAAGLGIAGADIAKVAKALRAAGRISALHESDEEALEASEEA